MTLLPDASPRIGDVLEDLCHSRKVQAKAVCSVGSSRPKGKEKIAGELSCRNEELGEANMVAAGGTALFLVGTLPKCGG